MINNNFKIKYILNIKVFLALSACQKDDFPSYETGSLTDAFTPELKRFESIFNMDQDIQFFFHHYADGEFKLVNGYDNEKNKDLKLFINDREMKFTKNRHVISGKDADFGKNLYGKNNKINYTFGKKKLEYNFEFPETINVEMKTPRGIIMPNKTTLNWHPDKEAVLGIVVTYINKDSEKDAKSVVNYEVIRNSGKYVISDNLFDNIPDNARVYIDLIQGNYLEDKRNSVKLIAFSMDYKTLSYKKN